MKGLNLNLDIFKKNWLSLTLGVIAVLAVVGNFYPMNKKRDDLHAEVMTHAGAVNTLHDLLNKQRNQPIIVPGSTESVPLTGFPTHKIVEAAHVATDQVNTASTKLMATAIDRMKTAHPPLFVGALPGAPGQTLEQSSFARAYVDLFPAPVQPGAAAPPAPATAPAHAPGDPNTPLIEILHAGMPPSDADLAQKRSDKQKDIETTVTRTDASGHVSNPDEVQEAEASAFRDIGEQMRTDAAKNCKVYVDPAAFAIYPGMTSGAVPDPTNIFWAQIGLWTQQDICEAIATTNASSANVMEAPIKELLKIGFVTAAAGQQSPAGVVPVFVIPGLQASSGVSAGGGMPPPPPGPPPGGGDAGAAGPNLGDPNGALPKNFQLSPSGRISNALYDVVQFEVELIADAGSVPQALAGMGAGQYITVTQVESIDPVDSAYYRGGGYYFGSKPCVRIKMRCEELYFRDWLKDYVPLGLKTALGYSTQPPAPAAQ